MLTVAFLDAGILSCSYSSIFLLICFYYYPTKNIQIFKKNKNQDLIHLSIYDDASVEAVHDHGLLNCTNMFFKFPAKDFLRFITFFSS